MLRKLSPGLLLLVGVLVTACQATQAVSTQAATTTTAAVIAAPTSTPTLAAAVPTATPFAVPPTETSEASVPSGWETHTDSRLHYSISYPSSMEGADNGDYSWTFGMKLANPDDGARNFIYVSAIPAGFQSSGGDIYNYNTAEADILLNMQVGESKSLREGLDIAARFSYTRLPDMILNGQTARVYESTQPWEFPQGTKEVRYYVQTEAYTYLLGGYLDTTGSSQPGVISEALFDQIIASFQTRQ